MALYEIGVSFQVDDTIPPPRNALHAALEHVRGFIVCAHSSEEAEVYAEQIRDALIGQADA